MTASGHPDHAVAPDADREERRLAEEVARREGLSPDDLDVRVLVTTFSALVRTASELWRAGDQPLMPAIERTLRECVARLRERLG